MPHRRSNRAEMSGLRGWHWPQGQINSRWSGPIRRLHREIQRAFTSRKGGPTVSRGRGSASGLSHRTSALPDASLLKAMLVNAKSIAATHFRGDTATFKVPALVIDGADDRPSRVSRSAARPVRSSVPAVLRRPFLPSNNHCAMPCGLSSDGRNAQTQLVVAKHLDHGPGLGQHIDDAALSPDRRAHDCIVKRHGNDDAAVRNALVIGARRVHSLVAALVWGTGP